MRLLTLVVLMTLSVSSIAYPLINRNQFVDQLADSTCTQPPEQIFIDTSHSEFDMATALSLSWVSTVV